MKLINRIARKILLKSAGNDTRMGAVNKVLDAIFSGSDYDIAEDWRNGGHRIRIDVIIKREGSY